MDDTPTCTAFTPSCVTHDELDAYCDADFIVYEGDSVVICESMVSLFHYFDCQAALKKCEAVILGPDRVRCSPSRWGWFWLPMAVRYGMKELEGQCFEAAVTDKKLLVDHVKYKRMLEAVSRETLLRLLVAAVTRE